MFIWSTLKKNQNPLMLAAFTHLLDDKWTMSWMSIQHSDGLTSGFETKEKVRQALNNRCINYIIQVKASHDTLQTVPQPDKWFALPPHVNDTLFPAKYSAGFGQVTMA